MHVALHVMVIYGVINFIIAVFSGVAGGGAGFVATPVLIALGLSPAQAISTGKFGGLAVSVGSLGGFKGAHGVSRKHIAVIMAIALVIGLVSPHFITRIDDDAYRITLGILVLAMVPIMVYKRVGLKARQTTRRQKLIGYSLVSLALLMQGIFSGGMGTLVNVALMSFVGMPALDASVAKRYSQLVLNAVIVLGVFGAGLIVWPLALVAMVTSLVGGFIGARWAVKKGDAFVAAILITTMVISGLWLIFG